MVKAKEEAVHMSQRKTTLRSLFSYLQLFLYKTVKKTTGGGSVWGGKGGCPGTLPTMGLCVNQGSSEKQSQQCIYRPIKGGFLQELAHTMMEAEKSHDLLSASWRPKKACGVIQSESEGQRTSSPRV